MRRFFAALSLCAMIFPGLAAAQSAVPIFKTSFQVSVSNGDHLTSLGEGHWQGTSGQRFNVHVKLTRPCTRPSCDVGTWRGHMEVDAIRGDQSHVQVHFWLRSSQGRTLAQTKVLPLGPSQVIHTRFLAEENLVIEYALRITAPNRVAWVYPPAHPLLRVNTP